MRRDFLKYCALAGLGLTVPARNQSDVRAEDRDRPYEGPFYVAFGAQGGWDTTYLMDPRGTAASNRLYHQDDIQTHGAHRYAPTKKIKTEGLSNEEFFTEFGSELLVLNGLDYSVNNHAPGSRYMATGKLDSMEYPTFAALAAACRGPNCPLAYLTFDGYAATGNLIPRSSVPYPHSLQKMAYADGIEGNAKAPYHDQFVLDRIDQAMAEQEAARAKQPRLPRTAHAQNMLYAAQSSSQALRRVGEFIPSKIPNERLKKHSEIALASFKAGVCVSANFTLLGFDSHANNDRDQMKLIPTLLDGIAHFLRRAEELKIRERIVMVIHSEMGRTPGYNKQDGKDHWSIGSVMFLGQGIRGNRVVGATDENQLTIPINPATLACDKEHGIRVRPEHLHHALRELAGIAEHPLAKKFPLGVATGERLASLWG